MVQAFWRKPFGSNKLAMKRPASALGDAEPSVVAIAGVEPYYLKSSGPGVYATPEGDFVGVAYEIVRKSSGLRRSARPLWGKPLKLSAVPDPAGRCDLHVWLNDNNKRWHTLYHRLVAFTFLKCYWNDTGGLVRKPFKVPLAKWGDYDVHHLDSNTRNVSVSNLAILTKECHRAVTSGSVELALPPVWPYVKTRSRKRNR